MPNNELQELLGARFERYTHSTNETVWTAIEAQLNAEKSNRIGFWFWIFNGIAAFLLIGIMVASGIQTAPLSKSQISTINSESKFEKNKDQNSFELKEVPNTSIINSSTVNSTAYTKSTTSASLNDLQNGKLNNNSMIAFPTQQKSDEIIEQKSDQNQSVIAQKTIENPRSISATLTTRSISANLFEMKQNEILPKSLIATKTPYFKRLPIHLGLEFTYLNYTRLGTKSTPIIAADSSYNDYMNIQLGKSRHFEFELFSQFDLTPRLSASIGLAYSFSTLDSIASIVIISGNLSSIITAKQQLFAVPVELKYAFVQKNRFALSLGMTAQTEFGQNEYLKTTYDNMGISGFPENIIEETTSISNYSIKQFAIEPFIQFSMDISPRISSFINLGYRAYLHGTDEMENIQSTSNYFNSDFGLQFQIH